MTAGHVNGIVNARGGGQRRGRRRHPADPRIGRGAFRVGWNVCGSSAVGHARTSAMLLAIASLLFGVFTICHALDLTDAVATGKPWARPLAAMLLCLALTLAAHVITVNL